MEYYTQNPFPTIWKYSDIVGGLGNMFRAYYRYLNKIPMLDMKAMVYGFLYAT